MAYALPLSRKQTIAFSNMPIDNIDLSHSATSEKRLLPNIPPLVDLINNNNDAPSSMRFNLVFMKDSLSVKKENVHPNSPKRKRRSGPLRVRCVIPLQNVLVATDPRPVPDKKTAT